MAKESNPWQTWRRNRDKGITAINDLVLLANTLPEEKRAELFTTARIQELMEALLGYPLQEEIRSKINKAVEEYNTKVGRDSSKEDVARFEHSYQEDIKKIEANPLFEPQFNARRAELAAILASKCMEYCYEQFSKIEGEKAFHELTLEKFQQTRSLAYGIAAKVKGVSERLPKKL